MGERLMLDDATFARGSAAVLLGILPPEAPLAMPTQVIERRRARRRARWLRRLLRAAA